MTTQDYIKAMDELDRQRAELKRQYIESNQPIPPGRIVMVDGRKVWLDCYKVIGIHIQPRFQRLNLNGQRGYISYQAKDYKSMKPIEE
jgi:hypothetical protein